MNSLTTMTPVTPLCPLPSSTGFELRSEQVYYNFYNVKSLPLSDQFPYCQVACAAAYTCTMGGRRYRRGGRRRSKRLARRAPRIGPWASSDASAHKNSISLHSRLTPAREGPRTAWSNQSHPTRNMSRFQLLDSSRMLCRSRCLLEG